VSGSVTGIGEGKRRKWLHAHIASPCPNCGCRQWGMTEQVIVPTVVHHGGETVVQDKALCLLPAVCTHCQLTVFYVMSDGDSQMLAVPKLSAETIVARDNKLSLLYARGQLNGFLLAIAACDLLFLAIMLANFLIHRFHF
jgi:hypothetical protein